MLEEDDNSDSLELLLDTLCNALGGIILITLLIALISQEAPDSTGGAPPSFGPQAELEQQHLTRLSQEVEIEEADAKSLEEKIKTVKGSGSSRMSAEQQSLEQRRKSESDEITRLERRLTAIPDDSVNLANDLDARQLELEDQTNQLTSRSDGLNRGLSSLSEQLEESQSSLVATSQDRTERRLPKEQASRKEGIWIVVKHGKIYPVQPSFRNIFSITARGGGESFKPKEGEGFDVLRNPSSLVDFFKTINKENVYPAFFVFSDDVSFKAFEEAKKFSISKGFDYTWEPTERDIALSSEGASPRPPQ
jgi:hypothetical protein